MEVSRETLATGTVGVVGLFALLRMAIMSWYKDRATANANDATTQVISTLRDELTRFATVVSETSKLNQQLREERDGLRTEVIHLTYSVNALKDIMVEILGEERAQSKFIERGIHKKFTHGYQDTLSE